MTLASCSSFGAPCPGSFAKQVRRQGRALDLRRAEQKSGLVNPLLSRRALSFVVGAWHRGRELCVCVEAVRDGVAAFLVLRTVNPDGTVTNPSYRPVTIFSPIDGHAITMYDTVSAAAQKAVANVDTNDSNLKQRYDGFEINFSARLPNR